MIILFPPDSWWKEHLVCNPLCYWEEEPEEEETVSSLTLWCSAQWCSAHSLWHCGLCESMNDK